MQTSITPELVVFFCTVLGVIAAAWYRIENAIKSSKKELKDELTDRMSVVSMRVESANALVSLIQKQMQDDKVQYLENFVRRDSVRELREEMKVTLNEIKSNIANVQVRIDRVMDLEIKNKMERFDKHD